MTKSPFLRAFFLLQHVLIATNVLSGSQVPICDVFDILSPPLQASVYTTAILFALSQELSRIGVHCVHRHVNFLFLGSAHLDASSLRLPFELWLPGIQFFQHFCFFLSQWYPTGTHWSDFCRNSRLLSATAVPRWFPCEEAAPGCGLAVNVWC